MKFRLLVGNGIGWNVIRMDVMGWDVVTECDVIGWDRMWWDRMGCDGKGWNGIGWNVMWCNLTSIDVSCLQYILEINSKLGHQHTRWSGEFCFVAVLARFKKWKTWLTSPYFPRSARFLLVVILTGLLSTFSTKKTVVTYSIKTVHQARKLGTRKLNKRDRPNPLAPYFYFVLFIFISVFLVSSLYGVRKSWENNYKQIVSGQKVEI